MLWLVLTVDSHLVCARYRDKGKGKDPCVEKPDSDGTVYLAFSPEQRLQLSTPSYKIKKEKQEGKKLESTPSQDSNSLVDPSEVAILGAVDQQGSVKSPPTSPPPTSASKHQPTSKAKSSRLSSNIEHPGTGSSAAKHQPTSKAQANQPTSTEHSGTDPSATKQQSTSKLRSQRPHSD